MSIESPLAGGDRIKIVIFFLLLAGTIFFGVVPILIALAGIYIMKKDKSFSPIINSRKYIKIYLFLLAIAATIIGATISYNENGKVVNWKEYNKAVDVLQENYDNALEAYRAKEVEAERLSRFPTVWDSMAGTKNKLDAELLIGRPPEIPTYVSEEPYTTYQIESKTVLTTIIGLVLTPIFVFVFLSLFDFLYFKPLQIHSEWVVNYGIFSDSKDNQDDGSTGIMGRDKLSSFSVADELIKWNDLLEKKLVSQEEFDKVKQKLLNQK